MLDLDALLNPATFPVVKLGGVEHKVHPLTAEGARKIAAAQGVEDAGATAIAAMQAVAKAALPTADTSTLTIEQLSRVVELASGQVAAVERAIGERAEKN